MSRLCLLQLGRNQSPFTALSCRLHGFSGKRNDLEKLWRDFFSDPSQWTDQRPGKVNPNSPDFKHKSTRESLWLENRWNPSWVALEIASVAPGSTLTSKSWVRKQPGHNTKVETLWRRFFSDPSQWWDTRPEKDNPKFPDFKHKRTHEALWLLDTRNPPWVISEMASITPGMIQMNPFSWTRKLSKFNKAREYESTLKLFEQMQQEGIRADCFAFVPVLNACAGLHALEKGKQFHSQAIEIGCESDLYVSNSLVDMYSKCGSIDDAWKVFDRMTKRDVVTWNIMISGFVNCGLGLEAVELYRQMQLEGFCPDSVTFVGILKACTSILALEEGKLVHEHIMQSGCELDAYVGSSLVDMYAKCGRIEDALEVFRKMPVCNVVAWTAIILGLVNSGQGRKAIDFFQQMQLDGVQPDSVTFIALLNACASLGALEEGKRVHERVKQCGFESHDFIGSSLVDMYAKCGSIEDAFNEFNNMSRRSVVAWTAMIQGFVNCGQGLKAIELFEEMQRSGVEPDSVTFVGLLNACASLASLEEGERIHEVIKQSGFESDPYIGSSLVDMYAKCGSIEDAWVVFTKMPTRGVVAWTAMILGLVKCGQGLRALKIFQEMLHEGVEPNSITLVGLVNACASIGALDEGRHIHEHIKDRGCESDAYVGSSLVDMYSKCGSIDDALIVFNKMPIRGVVAWTSMILGHVKCGQGQKALELFRRMEWEGVEPNSCTFVGLLNACGSIGALEEGRQVHELIIQGGCEFDTFVGMSLIDMYAKCRSMEDAWKVFNSMPTRSVGAWTAMILGYVNCGQGLKALEIFQGMQQEEVDPDPVTFVGLLRACASIAALEEGKLIHQQTRQSGCEFDAHVGSSLIDMYAKCGSIEDALTVFNSMPTRGVVAWTAMIGGYAMHGRANEAVALFERMSTEGVEINEVTFVCLLSACNHGGLVKEGLQYFKSMKSVYGVSPDTDHYTCMVDLLGRAGRLDDALEMVRKMSMEPDARVWMALLGACRIHGNVEMGQLAAHHVLKLDPRNSAGYVLLSNIYAASGDLDSSEMVHRQRLERGAWKQPGHSWIEVNSKMHSFVVNDSTHPQIKEIHSELNRLSERMKQAGYIADTKFALHDEEEETKRDHLCYHSEKLALAFGLINTPCNAPIFVVKNLRVCGDCHIATKFISKIVGRTITVRDASRFHHFKDGCCSCGDYW